jgi:hypothetical protein
MKRIAALAALVVTMLAVPAAALADTGASTGGSGPGYGRPGPIQVACHPGYVKGQRLRAYTQAYLKRHRHGKPVTVRTVCPYIPAKPRPAICEPQRLVFDMAAGSSTVAEVSGPVLSPAQQFSYDGSAYTIMSVNPGAGRFTVFKDGWPFVNQGTAITAGVGWLGCPA